MVIWYSTVPFTMHTELGFRITLSQFPLWSIQSGHTVPMRSGYYIQQNKLLVIVRNIPSYYCCWIVELYRGYHGIMCGIVGLYWGYYGTIMYQHLGILSVHCRNHTRLLSARMSGSVSYTFYNNIWRENWNILFRNMW